LVCRLVWTCPQNNATSTGSNYYKGLIEKSKKHF
jgi:hypothetical protein